RTWGSLLVATQCDGVASGNQLRYENMHMRKPHELAMHNPKTGRILAALPVFDACIRAGSFTRAAQRLDVTQSAVTRRIQALEADLGVALFRREGRALKPTEDGMALWTYAVETLNDL